MWILNVKFNPFTWNLSLVILSAIFNVSVLLVLPLFIYLSQKQKEMLRALQSGGKVIVKPRKTQSAGFWGTLLASIGVSLTIEAIRKN